MPSPAETALRVRFYELDPYGHVNHSVYIQYCEAARVEMLIDIGFGLDSLAETGNHLLVIGLRARYLAPAHLGETLTVLTGVSNPGRVRATWLQQVRRGDDVLMTAAVDFACTATDGRPKRMPSALIDALAPRAVPSDWLGANGPQ